MPPPHEKGRTPMHQDARAGPNLLAPTIHATTPDGRDYASLYDELLAPFPLSELESRKGGGKTFNYVTLPALRRRLDLVVGPGRWHWTNVRRCDGPVPTYAGTLIVLDVFQDGVGSHVSAKKAPRDGAAPDEEREDAMSPDDVEKSAATDAFKRACTAHGLGLYLQRLKASNPSWAACCAAARECGWQGTLPRDVQEDMERANQARESQVQTAVPRSPEPERPARSAAPASPRAAQGTSAGSTRWKPQPGKHEDQCEEEGCYVVLTGPQRTASLHNFGRLWCLTHQKGKERVSTGQNARAAR